jgi:hypothetical protein
MCFRLIVLVLVWAKLVTCCDLGPGSLLWESDNLVCVHKTALYKTELYRALTLEYDVCWHNNGETDNTDV